NALLGPVFAEEDVEVGAGVAAGEKKVAEAGFALGGDEDDAGGVFADEGKGKGHGASRKKGEGAGFREEGYDVECIGWEMGGLLRIGRWVREWNEPAPWGAGSCYNIYLLLYDHVYDTVGTPVPRVRGCARVRRR